MENTSTLLDPENIFAVVGASNDPAKYGFKVYKMLKDAGYRVYPVNPKATAIQGDPAFASLDLLPTKPNVVSIITPPTVSLEIVKQAHALGIPHIWLQPGAEDQTVIDYAQQNDIAIIHNQCILIAQTQKTPTT
jgi:uncharacterized protein